MNIEDKLKSEVYKIIIIKVKNTQLNDECEKYQRKINHYDNKIIPDIKNSYQHKDIEI